jgi:uncharacterized protein DUF4157
MLHAPTRDNQKVNNGAQAPAAKEPERILHPPYGRHERRYSAVTGAAGELGSSQNHRRSAEAQQAYGNQAVLQTLSHSPAKQPTLQKRGVENGNLEPKSEPVADIGMRLAEPRLQRKCGCGGSRASGGECEECKQKEEMTLRRQPASRAERSAAPSIVHDVLRSPGRSLNAQTRAFFEPRFGHDLGQVRIHTDACAAESAAVMNAEAYTVGSHIVFGSDRYRPDTLGGLHLIAHELAHAIQQGTQTPVLQKSLEVGKVDDPSETAADRAADAVVFSGPVPSLAPSKPLVRRRWVERTPGNEDVRIVWENYKTRYRVTRTHELKPHTGSEWCPPSLTAGADRANVWLRVEWCRGTKGKVEVGADIPQQLQNLIRDMVQTITSGGNAEDVVKKTNLSPYVNVEIAKSGAWQLSGKVYVTVGQQGVTGGGGRVEVQKEGGPSLGLEGSAESVGGGKRDIRVVVTGSIPLGSTPKFDCPTRERVTVVETVNFVCAKEEYVPPHDVPAPEKKVPDSRKRYIYFLHAQDKVNHDLVGEGDLTASNLDALKHDLSEGYRVSEITGYTSPEGPMKRGPGFEGNVALAKERAVAAKNLVLQACTNTIPARAATGQLPPLIPPTTLRMRFPSPQAPSLSLNVLDTCFVRGADSVAPLGCDQGPAPKCTGGELYTKVVGEKELEGKPLREHAVPAFEQAKDEPQRTPELSKQLEQKRTLTEKAELIYPKLRRAEIVLVGERTLKKDKPTHEEGGFKPSDTPCPPDIVETAFPRAEDVLRSDKVGKCK